MFEYIMLHLTDQQLNTPQVPYAFQGDAIKFVGVIFRETLCPLHKQMGMCFVQKWFSRIDPNLQLLMLRKDSF